MVPSFTARSLSGHDLVVGQTGDSTGKQLVFLFTTTCPFCRNSLDAWKALAESVAVRNDTRLSVVGLSLDSLDATAKYVAHHGIGFDVAFFPDLRSKVLFRSGNSVERYDIDLWFTSQVFQPGHRLRVSIGSALFPKYDRNLTTGGNNERDSTFVTAHQRLLHDAAHPTHVTLPVIPR